MCGLEQAEKEALEAEVARYEEAVREADGAVQRQRAEATALAAGIAGAEKASGPDECPCCCGSPVTHDYRQWTSTYCLLHLGAVHDAPCMAGTLKGHLILP